MKRKMFIALSAMLCVFLIGSSALAVKIDFMFENVYITEDTSSAYLGNSTSTYKLELDSQSNVSSTNVFGARPREVNGSVLGQYHTYSSIGTVTRRFSERIEKKHVYWRCKKDDISSYTGVLTAHGNILA